MATDLVVFSREALLCQLYKLVGAKFQTKLYYFLEKRNASAAFAMAARHQEWLSCGWLQNRMD